MKQHRKNEPEFVLEASLRASEDVRHLLDDGPLAVGGTSIVERRPPDGRCSAGTAMFGNHLDF